LINEQTTKELRLKIVSKTDPNSKPLLSANGSEVEIIGHVMAELYLKGLKVTHQMEVVKSLSPFFILGMDFFMANQAGINYALRPPMFTLYDVLIELSFFTRCDENNCVTLARTVCVPAYNEAYVQVETPMRYNIQEIILEQPPCALSVSVARALAFCKTNKAICCVLNTNPYVVMLKKGLKLAKIAGLTNSVLSMREISQPPLSSTSGKHKQMCTHATTASEATVRVTDESGIQVTDVGVTKSEVTNRRGE